MDPPSLPRTLFSPFQCGQLLRVCNFANCRPRFDYFLFPCCLLLSERGPLRGGSGWRARLLGVGLPPVR